MARAVASLLALPVLAACIGVGPVDPATLEAVRRGETTMVMLRFEPTDQDGKAVPAFAHSGAVDDNLRLAFGGFEEGGIPRDVYPLVRFPTGQARAEGIAYVPLPPGFHYLAIQGSRRADVFSDARQRRAAPLWRIEVPPGVQVLYAGTFRLSVATEGLLFGGVVITAIDHAATRVEDEGDRAAAAVARDLPGLGPPVTRLAVRHEGPILLGTPSR